MSKVTSKNQVSIPKAVAERHGIRPGTELEFVSIGDAIRVTKKTGRKHQVSSKERLQLFRQIWERIQAKGRPAKTGSSKERDWSRDELYAERVTRWPHCSTPTSWFICTTVVSRRNKRWPEVSSSGC